MSENKGFTYKEKVQVRKKRKRIIAAICIVLALFFSAPIGNKLICIVMDISGLSDFSQIAMDYPFNVHFLNTGKSDAILIQSQNKFALIDTATYDQGNKISDYLTLQQVDKLDYIFLTHPDADHIGGFSIIADKFPIDVVVEPVLEFVSTTPESALVTEKIKEYDITRKSVKSGEIIDFGDIVFEILAPVKTYPTSNDSSLVIKTEYQEFSFIFCADIERRAELDIVNSGADIRADLLKVAHHGSKTSTSAEFLEMVQPDYAVICVGSDINNLPNIDTTIALKEIGAQVYYTDIDGTIIFSANETDRFITTQYDFREE